MSGLTVELAGVSTAKVKVMAVGPDFVDMPNKIGYIKLEVDTDGIETGEARVLSGRITGGVVNVATKTLTGIFEGMCDFKKRSFPHKQKVEVTGNLVALVNMFTNETESVKLKDYEITWM